MIQRYKKATFKAWGGTCEIDNIEPDKDGKYVEWDSVKDQLEWRELTPECRPNDYMTFLMWLKEKAVPRLAYLVKDDLDENIHLYSEEGELTLSVQEIECKWKPIGTNPFKQ